MSVPVPDAQPVRRETLVFGQPFVDEAAIGDVVDVLRSGWLGRGPRTERFEQEFRTCVGARYARALNSGSAGLFLALEAAGQRDGVVHARHLYTVLLDVDRVRASRDEVRSRLRWHGIGTGVHYVPAHLHPYYEGRPGFAAGSFPHAEWIGERTLSLPLSAHLSERDVADVIEAMHEVLAPA